MRIRTPPVIHTRQRHLACAVILAIALTCLAGCAARARQRPLPTSDIETGPQTVEHVRRQLEGTWTLQRFQVFDAGVARDLRAQGRLTYDAYGNLRVEGVLLEPSPTASAPDRAELLNYSGRVVIDPARHELRLVDPHTNAPVSDTVRETLDPARVRQYSFENGQLVLQLVPPGGTPAARATFKKVP
jgi:hypothetical protein